jgi:hypothetical protein
MDMDKDPLIDMGHFMMNRGWWISFLRWVMRYPAFREISLMIIGMALGAFTYVVTFVLVVTYLANIFQMFAIVMMGAGIYLTSWAIHAIADRGVHNRFLDMLCWLTGALLWGVSTLYIFIAVCNVIYFISSHLPQ